MASATEGPATCPVNPAARPRRPLLRAGVVLTALLICLACGKSATELPATASLKAFAATPGSVLFIPATAHVSGAAGTNWRTDLELLNPGTTRATVTVQLLEAGQANLVPVERTINIEGGRTARYTDVLSSLFGFSGAAALRIVNSDGMVAVTSRTYNLQPGGTYGQFAGGMLRPTAIHHGQEGRIIQLTHNRARDAGFRTNIGFVNANATTTRVEVALYGADGSFYGELAYDLQPYQFRQVDKIYQQVVGGDVEDGYAVLTTPTADGAFFAYATVIDNRTGDPIYATPVIRAAAGGAQWDKAKTRPNSTPTATPTPPAGGADLSPYQDSGWSGPVVVSGTQGTTTSGGLVGGQATYVDWAMANYGDGAAVFPAGSNVARIQVDSSSSVNFYTENQYTLNAGYYVHQDDYRIDGIGGGQHTVTLLCDPDGVVAESNEGNNSAAYTGTWSGGKRGRVQTEIRIPIDPASLVARPLPKAAGSLALKQAPSGAVLKGSRVGRKAAYGDASYIPASAHATGASGTNWRTDVQLHNPGTAQAQVEIALLRRGQNNPSPQVRSFTVNGGRSLRLVDILDSAFGFSGAAALRITPLSGDVIASSRTYNLQPGGTYGLYAGAVSELAAFSQGERAVLMQLTHDTATDTGFRTNVGMLNCSGATINLTADFRTAAGTSLGTRSYSLGPWKFIQEDRIFRAVTGGAVADGYIVFTTDTEGGRFLAYATVVDNTTGDSIFIPAISVLGQEPAPVNTLVATQAIFEGLGEMGAGDAPSIEEVVADLQANGMEQMVATAVSLIPEGLATAIPGGVRVDFGSHLVLSTGNIVSGSVETTYSNVVISPTEVSFDFTSEQHNALWNGGYAEIDGLEGRVDSEVVAGGHVRGDLTVASFRRSAKSDGVTVTGDAHFDTSVCANYPISGSLTVSKDGEDYTIEFTDACDGSFEAPNQGQTGDVSFRLTWSTPEDLDLYVQEPNGTLIYYGAPNSSTGGQLDVDSNSGCDQDSNPVENVFWPVGQAPHGTYTFWVDRWSACTDNGGTTTPSFTLQVFEGNSVVRTINGVMPAGGETEHYTHSY